MKLKERSSTNLIKQWNIGGKSNYLKIMRVKIMINIFHPLWSAPTIGGGEKNKYELKKKTQLLMAIFS